jgi:hypothetical protein
MRKLFSVVFVSIGIAGCAGPKMTYTPDQEFYVHKAMSEEADFTIPIQLRNDVWDRGQALIGRFRVMKIQTLSDNVIQTYIPNNEAAPWISVARSQMGDSDYVTIRSSPVSDTMVSQRLEHVLSYYMFYGTEPPGDLITRLESDELGLEANGSPKSLGFWAGVLVGIGVLIIAVAAVAGGGGSSSQ